MPSYHKPVRSPFFNGPLYDKMADDCRKNPEQISAPELRPIGVRTIIVGFCFPLADATTRSGPSAVSQANAPVSMTAAQRAMKKVTGPLDFGK